MFSVSFLFFNIVDRCLFYFFFFLLNRIRHYAGPVTYSIEGFLEKNSDVLSRTISIGLYQSQLAIVQSLFPEGKFDMVNSVYILFKDFIKINLNNFRII